MLFRFVPTGDWMGVSQQTDGKIPTTCRLERAYREALEDRANGLNLNLNDLVRQ